VGVQTVTDLYYSDKQMQGYASLKRSRKRFI